MSDSDQSSIKQQGQDDEPQVMILRHRAADLLLSQREQVNRRIHNRMISNARKITDTEEVLSTALRRLDSLILTGRARARTDAQLFALVHEVIERAIREKARYAERIKRREKLVGAMRGDTGLQGLLPSGELFVRLGQLARDPVDKEIAMLRARGLRLHEIAESMGLPDTVIRKRWSRLKVRAREMLGEGTRDDDRQ